MEGNNVEHSDSDSGESWTILDNSPSYAEEAPEFPEHPANHESEAPEHTERDDDTDGISVISDSEPESSTPCEHITSEEVAAECSVCPTDPHTLQCDSHEENPQSAIHDDLSESIRAQDDFLGGSSTKMRTYVHRRNKRLSTVLNIIMLGSLITAAGIAIGHMWGADDCGPQPALQVNKILSNLYKLQEENAYLRSKLKELTLANNILSQQQKTETEKTKNILKKDFGEGLFKNDYQKCVDFDYCSTDKVLEGHMVQPEYEKEFLSDLNKLKNVYRQNKSWLDDEVARRQKYEEGSLKYLKSNSKASKDNISMKNYKETVDTRIPVGPVTNDETNTNESFERKVSYADSLKSDKDNNERKKRQNFEFSDSANMKEQFKKKKTKRQLEVISELQSDDDIKKDDRYSEIKYKGEKKKSRQKTNKKQKRRNKYEQWEMKGGYMKDFDDVSIASLQEDVPSKFDDKSEFLVVVSNDDEFNVENEKLKETKDKKIAEQPKKGNDKETWYDKRMLQRSEARRKMEQEMFGENVGGAAGWYFRRMRRREQGRREDDAPRIRFRNRRNMNYKTKQ